MKKLLSFLGILFALESYGQAGTEALHHYFKFVEVLKKDKPLTDSLWQSFLLQTGNKLYIETNNLSKQYMNEYRQKLEMVYRPSMHSFLQKQLPDDELLKVIYRYKTQEDKLKEHARWIEKTPLLDTMVYYARKFLPERLHELPFQPQIYYTTIGSDGSATDRQIFISLLASFDMDRIKAGAFGGHEIHHFLRKSKLIKPLASQHQGLYYALEAILNEGLADLVDKPFFLSKNSNWEQKEAYQIYLYDKAPAAILALNEVIEKLAATEVNYPDEQKYRSLMENSVGHIPGYFMAKTISDNGLLNELIEQADNPFAFAALYNKAARKGRLQVQLFSQTAIIYLNKLEKKYTKK